MNEQTDFVKLYVDIILKKTVAKIVVNQVKKEKAVSTAIQTAETGQGVRTMRHWKSVGANELYYSEIEKGFSQMRELDVLTGWSDKLHQDRFKFLSEKFGRVLHDYLKDYKEEIK